MFSRHHGLKFGRLDGNISIIWVFSVRGKRKEMEQLNEEAIRSLDVKSPGSCFAPLRHGGVWLDPPAPPIGCVWDVGGGLGGDTSFGR